MVEWSITPVLKTGVPRGTGGSNPSLSAKEDSQSNKTLTFNKLGFFFYPIKSDKLGFWGFDPVDVFFTFQDNKNVGI